MQEKAQVVIYDPKVDESQIHMDLTEPGIVYTNEKMVEKHVTIVKDAYEATKGADAIVVCTEWDEFKQLDYRRIYDNMHKPAFIFDGRLILDRAELTKIGFKVEVIGKSEFVA